MSDQEKPKRLAYDDVPACLEPRLRELEEMIGRIVDYATHQVQQLEPLHLNPSAQASMPLREEECIAVDHALLRSILNRDGFRDDLIKSSAGTIVALAVIQRLVASFMDEETALSPEQALGKAVALTARMSTGADQIVASFEAGRR